MGFPIYSGIPPYSWDESGGSNRNQFGYPSLNLNMSALLGAPFASVPSGLHGKGLQRVVLEFSNKLGMRGDQQEGLKKGVNIHCQGNSVSFCCFSLYLSTNKFAYVPWASSSYIPTHSEV